MQIAKETLWLHFELRSSRMVRSSLWYLEDLIDWLDVETLPCTCHKHACKIRSVGEFSCWNSCYKQKKCSAVNFFPFWKLLKLRSAFSLDYGLFWQQTLRWILRVNEKSVGILRTEKQFYCYEYIILITGKLMNKKSC